MRHSICIVLLTLAFNTSAQNNVEYRRCTSGCTSSAMNDGLNTSFTYNNVQSFETQDITSDYSWRDCPSCSTLWHKGTDYSSLDHGAGDIDRGDAIVTIDPGIVKKINAANSIYKYITVDSDTTKYGYGHIFHDADPVNGLLKSGKFVLKECEPPYLTYYAIIDLESCEGIADLTSDTATAKVVLDDLDNSICASDTIMVTNSIQSGEDIAPMGDAATGPVHLHLYRFKNSAGTHQSDPVNASNTGDPFYKVNHDVPDYTIEIQTEGESVNQIKLDYPGSNAQGIRARTTMQNAMNPSGANDRFSNVAMNLDKVKFGIKRSTDLDHSLIAGSEDSSKISLGAAEDPKYPADLTVSYGSWSKTGQYPYAYTSGPGNNQPYDDFFYSDFIPRIHQDDVMGDGTTEIAHCPMNTRYNDGSYEIKAEVIDVPNKCKIL